MTTKKRATPKKRVTPGKNDRPSRTATAAPRKPNVAPKAAPPESDAVPAQALEVQQEAARRIAMQWRHHLDHMSQKQGEKFQTQFEKSQNGLTIAADFARALARIEDHEFRVPDLVLPRFQIPACPKLQLADLDTIHFDHSTRKARAGVVRMAGLGWTYTHWLAPGYVAAFSRAPSKEIDDFFVERYLPGGSLKGRLKPTAEALLTSPAMKPWKLLLKQIFDYIQEKRSAVCVPALLTVIEEFVSDSLVDTLNQAPSDIRPHVDLENGLAWSSAVLFMSRLFGEEHFRKPGPPLKSQRWLSHPRPETRWKQVDALKLVNALATLHLLFKPES